MKTEFANLTVDQLNFIINKLGGREGALRFLRGEIGRWVKKDGLIYLYVASNGMTGEEWIEHFRKEGSGLSDYIDIYNRYSKYIEPSSGEAFEIVVLQGKLWDDNNRTSEKIRAYAMEQGFSLPTVELSYLIRDSLSVKDLRKMEISILVPMHEPIVDEAWDEPRLICVEGSTLSALYHYGFLFKGEASPKRWGRNDAFAFIKSRVSVI